MTEPKLPELPPPVDFSDVPEHAHVWGYTADQMRAFYRAGVAAGATSAAKRFWEIGTGVGLADLMFALQKAAAIRKSE